MPDRGSICHPINVTNGHFHLFDQHLSYVRSNFDHELDCIVEDVQRVNYYVSYRLDMFGQFLRKQFKSLIDTPITGN